MNKTIMFKVGKIYKISSNYFAQAKFIAGLGGGVGAKILSVDNLPLLFVEKRAQRHKNNVYDLYIFLYNCQFYCSYNVIFQMDIEEVV